jgi:hypothetical protein
MQLGEAYSSLKQNLPLTLSLSPMISELIVLRLISQHSYPPHKVMFSEFLNLFNQ